MYYTLLEYHHALGESSIIKKYHKLKYFHGVNIFANLPSNLLYSVKFVIFCK